MEGGIEFGSTVQGLGLGGRDSIGVDAGCLGVRVYDLVV